MVSGVTFCIIGFLGRPGKFGPRFQTNSTGLKKCGPMGKLLCRLVARAQNVGIKFSVNGAILFRDLKMEIKIRFFPSARFALGVRETNVFIPRIFAQMFICDEIN